jgi:HlyD family secretion protein
MSSERRRPSVTLIVAGAVALALAGLWYARSSVTPPPAVASLARPSIASPEDGRAPVPLGVSALGRLEPKDGVRHIAGPSLPSVVVQELLVDRGDRVQKGQLLATLDTADLQMAVVKEREADLANARREYARSLQLSRSQVESDSRRDEWATRVAVLEAQLDHAKAELRLTQVLAPIDGQVLDVHARAGERVGPNGILDLGATHAMFAIAEVYETDIGRVAVGQRARVSSPVFPAPVDGTVERIRPKIEKQDALGTDPAARKDARVIEVEIRLDECEASKVIAGLTLVQVEIMILPKGS